MTAFTLLTPPAIEPVTLSDTKTQARIENSADDTLVTALIAAARQWCEQFTGRAFITQTWRLWLDAAPASQEWWDGLCDGPVSGYGASSYVDLPRPPLLTITSVQVFDETDTGTVWSASNYFVDNVRVPGRLSLRTGTTWPVPTRLSNGIMIEYTAGYGSSATAVPEPIRLAIKQLATHWYENRGETVVGTSLLRTSSVPLVIEALLEPYRVKRMAI